MHYIYVMEVFEVIEEISDAEMDRLINEGLREHIDHLVSSLRARAAFSLNVLGEAWAGQVITLLRKTEPDRQFHYRRIRLLLDLDPPYAL